MRNHKFAGFVAVLALIILSVCGGKSPAGPTPPAGPKIPDPAPGTQVHTLTVPGGAFTLVFTKLDPPVGSEVTYKQEGSYTYKLIGTPTGAREGFISVMYLDGDTIVSAPTRPLDECDMSPGHNFPIGSVQANSTGKMFFFSSVTHLYARVWLRNADGSWPACPAAQTKQEVNLRMK